MKSGESVVLAVTAKGIDMMFNWVKLGDPPDDGITINLDNDQNYETESVLEIAMYKLIIVSCMIALSWHFVSTIWVGFFPLLHHLSTPP